MRILILLPGRPVDKDRYSLSNQELVEGLDVYDQSYWFSKFELVNNLLTVQAIREACPNAVIFVRHLVNRINPFQLIKGSRQLNKWCHQHNIDLVHQFWGGPGAWFIAKSLRIPLVLSLLGSDLYGAYNKAGNLTMKGRMLTLFSRLATLHASRVVVMSGKMREALSVTVQQKTMVIPEGIQVNNFYPLDKIDCRRKLNWPYESKTILFFDNGNRVKNAPLAWESLQKVQSIFPEASLFIAKGIAHNELINYYNAADLLLITSLHEGSNNSLKEALACNCPVVSTNVGDAIERIGRVTNSYVVSSFDAAPIAEAILQILNSQLRSDGAKTVNEFSINTIGKKLAVLYTEVLGKN